MGVSVWVSMWDGGEIVDGVELLGGGVGQGGERDQGLVGMHVFVGSRE